MQANRPAALSRILASEGGWRDTRELPEGEGEPGGASMHGISMLVFSKWRTDQGKPVPTFDDLHAISDDETAAIYDALYFTPARFDELQSGVDYMLVDWMVENGPGGTLDIWRGLLRLKRPLAYWRMDDVLLNALNSRDAKSVIDRGCNVRWEQMQLRPDFPQIGKGLAFRVSSVHRGACEMIGLAAEPPKYAAPALTPPQ